MHRKQRGVTFLGWIILLIPVALVIYAVIRLAPIYLNYSRVARSLSQVAQEEGSGSPNASTIRVALEKRFDIESIEFPRVQDVVVRRDGQSWVIEAKYEETAPLFANLAILVTFSKTERIGKASLD